MVMLGRCCSCIKWERFDDKVCLNKGGGWFPPFARSYCPANYLRHGLKVVMAGPPGHFRTKSHKDLEIQRSIIIYYYFR
jgi:hypothetical protein